MHTARWSWSIALWLVLAGCHKGDTPLGAPAASTEPSPRRQPAATPTHVPARLAPEPASASVVPDEHAPTPAQTACSAASDCELVSADCCGCTNGGKQVVIARAAKAAYEDARLKRCSGVRCISVMSTDPSCAQGPACVAGHCVLVAEEPAAR